MQALVLLIALLGSTVVAQNPRTTVNQQCFTRFSDRRTATIRTTNFGTTTRRTAVLTVVSTPSTTITPAAQTSMVTTTRTLRQSITAPTSTDTYTTSRTITTTQTDHETEHFTQTVTTSSTTTLQSTTTIAPPAGFTNLAAMPGYFPKRNAVVEKREALEERAAKQAFLPIIPEAKITSPAVLPRQAGGAGSQFPVAVSCTRRTTIITTRTVTVTRATSTATAATPTIFSTITRSTTSTITITPASATRIITVSTDTSTTTETTTSSTTTTNTQTITVNVASATYLAQCAPANIVSSAVGQKIGTISFNPAFTLQSFYPADTTGYGCCAACAADKNCAGFAQGPGPQGACYYITTDGRCDMAQSWGNRFHYYNTNGDGYKVGNAQCGFLGPKAGLPVTS